MEHRHEAPHLASLRCRRDHRDNDDRLVRIKHRYDPTNPFRLDAGTEPNA
jgi:hypothetical protein